MNNKLDVLQKNLQYQLCFVLCCTIHFNLNTIRIRCFSCISRNICHFPEIIFTAILEMTQTENNNNNIIINIKIITYRDHSQWNRTYRTLQLHVILKKRLNKNPYSFKGRVTRRYESLKGFKNYRNHRT